MALPRKIKRLFALLGLAALVAPAHASHSPSEGTGAEPCAIVSDFSGSVQILDSSRTHLIDVEKRASVPCGGWVSAEAGWVKLHHRDGYTIHLAKGSFAQFPQRPEDSVVLFKGQAFARVSNGMPRMSLITANARARVEQGSVIMIYEPENEMSQVVALQGEASFENRFQAARKVQVKAGETSQMNLQQLRVLPSIPSAIALASLKPRFAELKLNEREEESATRKVVARAERKFVSAQAVAKTPTMEEDETPQPKRSIAGLEFKPEIGEDSALKAHFVRKLGGGQHVSDKMLFPKGHLKGQRSPKAQVEVVDPAEGFNRKIKQEEDQEKRRLIQELSQIRIE